MHPGISERSIRDNVELADRTGIFDLNLHLDRTDFEVLSNCQRLISNILPLCKLLKMLLQVKQEAEDGWHHNLLQLSLLKLILE